MFITLRINRLHKQHMDALANAQIFLEQERLTDFFHTQESIRRIQDKMTHLVNKQATKNYRRSTILS